MLLKHLVISIEADTLATRDTRICAKIMEFFILIFGMFFMIFMRLGIYIREEKFQKWKKVGNTEEPASRGVSGALWSQELG